MALHSVSVAGVVIDDSGRMLATKRADNGRWEPPGGVLESEEGIEAGLVREFLEETGLEVEPVRLTGVYKNMRRQIVGMVFRVEVVGGTLHTTSEVTEYGWLTPEEVRDRMTEAYAVRMLDALSEGPPAVRMHDGVRLLGV